MDIENSGDISSSPPSSPSLHAHAPTHHTTTSTIQRFMYLLVLSLGMFLVAYEILRQSNIEVEHVKVRVKNAVGRIYDKTYTPEDDPYEPLEIGEMFADWDFDGNNYYKKEENATTTKTITTGGSLITNKKKKNPRMTCFMDARATCASLMEQDVIVHVDAPYSIPKKIVSSSGKSSDTSSEDDYIHGEETELCTLSDPSYQSIPAAPSTCNDVHALPFRFGPTESQPLSGLSDVVYTSRHSTKYLTSGGFRAVWTITQLFEEDAEEVRRVEVVVLVRCEEQVVFPLHQAGHPVLGRHDLDVHGDAKLVLELGLQVLKHRRGDRPVVAALVAIPDLDLGEALAVRVARVGKEFPRLVGVIDRLRRDRLVVSRIARWQQRLAGRRRRESARPGR